MEVNELFYYIKSQKIYLYLYLMDQSLFILFFYKQYIKTDRADLIKANLNVIVKKLT